ncbi:MAG: ATP synthase F1 subunit delta [Candidatus Cloacimonetes bacterium]|nr:ATP synthase F1 subunit delta [Candidatus Cloacimonadota bacterium]
MIRNIIARRYSKALLEVIEDSDLPRLENELLALQTILKDNLEIEKFFISPIVEDSHKKEIVELLMKELRAQDVIKNFLNVLIDKERIFFIADILNELLASIHKRLGIYDFDLVTAHEIDENTFQKIKKFVAKYVDGEVLFNHKINPNIKGGFLAYNDEMAINASIRNNLDELKRKF